MAAAIAFQTLGPVSLTDAEGREVHALRQALRVIRGSLGDVITSRGDDEIGLDFERLQCDTDAFDRAITGGLWDEALALYRGDLLDGFFISGAPEFERWLDERRARL